MKKNSHIIVCIAFVFFVEHAQAVTTDSQPTKVSNFKNFQHIIIKGAWQTNIIAGDNYHITITTPYYSSSSPPYTVVQNDDTVTISNVNAKDKNNFNVIITTPQLANLELYGKENITLSGFHLKNLSLSLKGSQSLSGINSQIDNLKLYATGTSSIDLTDTKITDVNLDISGTNATKLNMQGGNLTVQAAGTTTITYLGDIKIQKIDSRGDLKVEKIKS